MDNFNKIFQEAEQRADEETKRAAEERLERLWLLDLQLRPRPE